MQEKALLFVEIKVLVLIIVLAAFQSNVASNLFEVLEITK